jgi:hypothetical protein
MTRIIDGGQVLARTGSWLGLGWSATIAAVATSLAGCGSTPLVPYYDGLDAGTVVLSIMATPSMANRYFVRIDKLAPDGQREGGAGEFAYVNDGSSWARLPDFSDDGMLGLVLVAHMEPGLYQIASFDRDLAPAVRCKAPDSVDFSFKVERNTVTYLGRFRHEPPERPGGVTTAASSDERGMDLSWAQMKVGPTVRGRMVPARVQRPRIPCHDA